jgi:hypothetical protein
VYSLIGDGNTLSYYKINPSTGDITVNNNLKLDVAPSYVARVRVYDDVFPTNTATGTVTILVTRNKNSPICGSNPTLQVDELAGLAQKISSLSATDADKVSGFMDSSDGFPKTWEV